MSEPIQHVTPSKDGYTAYPQDNCSLKKCQPAQVTKSNVLTQLQALKPDLAQRYAISQIGIFGSVARSEDHDGSDIDVIVHMQPDMLKRAGLKAELEKQFGREVDVIRYRESMNPYLKARIDQDAVYV